MAIKTAKKSSLFLMELLIAILFFALASAVCIQLFVKSHLLSQESRNLNMAVNQAQSLAEGIRGTDGDVLSLTNYFPDGTAEGNSFSVYYDENWNPCGESEGRYAMTAVITAAPKMLSSEITISDRSQNSEIYQLVVDKHINLSRGTAKGR